MTIAAWAPLMVMAAAFPDNTDWARTLERHVTPQHLVAYRSLDRAALDHYAAQLAGPWPADVSGDARKAALINAYNALTVRWVASNYPVESIWRTRKPFTERRHVVNGARVSLDDIEGELRKMDPRVHGALVCAARSCPPLRREPYVAERVNAQLDDNMREWLAMPDRNRFDATASTAYISKIFDWYAKDFAGVEGVRRVLATYAPSLAAAKSIRYQPYHWGLNDASGRGAAYSDLKFYVDRARNN